jgi:hypothetical protein
MDAFTTALNTPLTSPATKFGKSIFLTISPNCSTPSRTAPALKSLPTCPGFSARRAATSPTGSFFSSSCCAPGGPSASTLASASGASARYELTRTIAFASAF